MTENQGRTTPPNESDQVQAPGRPDRQELLTLHQVHVAEYRFQVDLNWKRSQYFLAINLAVLAAGGGLLGGASAAGELVVAAVVFLAGAGMACLGYLIISWQHEYYRNTRDRLRGIQEQLGLREEAIGTTEVMGGTHVPSGKVTPMLKLSLVVLGLLDIACVGVAVAQLIC